MIYIIKSIELLYKVFKNKDLQFKCKSKCLEIAKAQYKVSVNVPKNTESNHRFSVFFYSENFRKFYIKDIGCTLEF